MNHRLPIALSAAALVVAVLSNGPLAAASSGLVRHALFADRAHTASQANVAKRATFAKTAATASNALAVNGLKASANGTPGQLFPLGSDGRLPPSVLPSSQPAVAVRAVRTTTQTIPIQIAFGPVTRVSFAQTDFLTGGQFFDASNPAVITVPADGYYLITGSVAWQLQYRSVSATWGYNRAVTIFVNDQGMVSTQGPPAEETRQNVELVWPFKAGDTLSLLVEQNDEWLVMRRYLSQESIDGLYATNQRSVRPADDIIKMTKEHEVAQLSPA
jgi:hypothetical protein